MIGRRVSRGRSNMQLTTDIIQTTLKDCTNKQAKLFEAIKHENNNNIILFNYLFISLN